MANQNLDDDDQRPNKQNTVDGFGPNDPGQQATIGADGIPEVGISATKDDLEEVVITAKRPTPAAGAPGRRTYNPLSKLASYTYNLTLYMITPDAYKQFVDSGRKKIDALSNATPVGAATNTVSGGAFILAQSGGVNNSNSSRATASGSEKVDYFIDNLRFKTLTNTKTTGTSTSAISELSFTITEPYGFSFISDLKRASEALKRYSDSTSYKSLSNAFRQFFILGIRFYGYDADGKLVKGSDAKYGEAIDPLGGDALFENFYDIQMSSCRFKLDGRTVVYNCRAVGINGQNLLGIKRGRMPTGTVCQGKTVHDALTGPLGLFTNLNEKEKAKLNLNPPSQTYANEFEVQYLGEAAQLIKEAGLVSDADLAKYRWGDNTATKTVESTDSQNSKPPKPEERYFQFNHDTAIISAIETIIKKSKFMEDALKTIYANVKQPDPEKKNYEQTQKEPNVLRWFSIKPEIKQADWDPKIGDWVYKTIYVIQLYDIPSVETPYAVRTREYYGPHKKYDYWFTGKNTEIIDMDFTFDYLYFNAVLGIPGGPNQTPSSSPGNRESSGSGTPSNSGPSTNNGNTTSNNTGLKADGAAPGEDNSAGTATGGGEMPAVTGVLNPSDRTTTLGVGLEAQNSVLTYLNDLGAYYSGRLKILGDPDFLIRDAASSINSLYNQFYDTNDFTINAQGGQVFVEVTFKEGKDYQNQTGLQKINENILFIEYPPNVKAIAQGAIVYMVADVESIFNRGRFEQTLNLIGPTFSGSKPYIPANQESPSGQAPNNQQTVQTPNNTQVADDDALQEVQITSKKVQEPQPRVEFDGTNWYDTDGNLIPTDSTGRPIFG